MVRHMMSHPVTVTTRDTSVTPSRHIRPSLEGGVYVTGAQLCGEDWERPPQAITLVDIQRRPSEIIPRRCQSGLAERVRDSFVEINHAKTAGTAPTHQWTRQRLCADRVLPRASRSLITSHHALRNPLCSNETPGRCHVFADQRRVCTRALSRPLTLLEASRRALGPGAEPMAKRRSGEALYANGRPEDPGGVVGAPNLLAGSIIDLLIHFRAVLFQILDGHVLKKLGGL
jgi:hypothetical protein